MATSDIRKPKMDINKGKGRNNFAANSKSNKGSRIKKKTSSGDNDNKGANRKNRRKSDGRLGRDNTDGKEQFDVHWPLAKCIQLYVDEDPTIIRGTLRALQGKDSMAFCSCDRGMHKRDIVLKTSLDRNRALHGDLVFVKLFPPEEDGDEPLVQDTEKLQITAEKQEMWQDDEEQMALWNPAVSIRRVKTLPRSALPSTETTQQCGRVVCIVPPKPRENGSSHRVMVGSLKVLRGGGHCLFNPSNPLLPQFKCPAAPKDIQLDDNNDDQSLYKAEYVHNSWRVEHKWPPCRNLKRLGEVFSIQDQIEGLLLENNVNHGEFPTEVLKDVDESVKSGVYIPSKSCGVNWKPTPDMYKGRRDFRSERIFTIDPSTAKDLDDALHIKQLPNGIVEIGVHIADVSYFVQPGTHVDKEALHRATTVYLVDRTVPMLPRPLCEIACSLNENVERLAFSCVWKMKLDGTMAKGEKVWYGRSVIRSCARLDYATAQNIIDNLTANGESEDEISESYWPKSRRPSGSHPCDDVAADVRLMHKVAMNRRKLRFSNGALALHGVKLTFRLDDDGETPLSCLPYPIKDSNRLVEEYMLLANYLVAQRLITHAGELAVLRHHPDPMPTGLDQVRDVGKEMFDFDIDATSSKALHSSLCRLDEVCRDKVVLQCVTQLLMTPMQNANYFAAGKLEKEEWRHFALNIPYYTHFTSPIRRYADVLVHRLLQATLDGQEAIDSYPLNAKTLDNQCDHCNEMRMAAKQAQERCDVVFLALYLRKHPCKGELGVVLSLGKKSFTVFLPALGVQAMLFLDEHQEWLTYDCQGEDSSNKRIMITPVEGSSQGGPKYSWKPFAVKRFTKIKVTGTFKEKPRLDVKVILEGPWKE